MSKTVQLDNKENLDQKCYKEFMIFRDQLIDQLEAGIIDKNQFLETSDAYFVQFDQPVQPPAITSYSQGMYLYQYFNARAKMEKALYQKLKYKEPFEAVEHRKASDLAYKNKERITLKILQFYQFKGIEAYAISSDSKKLKHKLVEILLPDQPRGILHTLDSAVIEALNKHGVMDFRSRISKIDAYVNTKYY